MAKDSKSPPPPPDLGDVTQVIRVFGGLRPLAAALGVPASTVQGWKERNTIPAGRHSEIRAAYAKRAQTSDIPVEHAIEAAAEMRDSAPFQANEQTRNYQPPRSQSVSANAGSGGVNAGGSNLILSLILFVLMILVVVVAYLLYLNRTDNSDDIAQELQGQLGQFIENQELTNRAVEQQLVDLVLTAEKTDISLGELQADFIQVKDLDESLTTTSKGLLAGLTSELEDAVLDVSSQLRVQVQDLTETWPQEQETDTSSELSQLFADLSQDMLAKIDTLTTNIDASVTEQIERLQQQVEMAQADALDQQRLAEENAARAQKAETALARATQWDAGISASDVVALTQLRIALAEYQEWESKRAILTTVADTNDDLLYAWQTLTNLAGTDYSTAGLPSPLSLLEAVERLIEVDRQEIHSGTLGFTRVPSAENLNTNQGHLAAGQAALAAGDFEGAIDHFAALNGVAAERSGQLMNDLNAHFLVDTAAAALDRWFAEQTAQD